MVSTISAMIPHRLKVGGEENLLRCIHSLVGYTEIVVVADDGLGIPQAFNACLNKASGEFICIIANDSFLVRGSLQDLVEGGGVTVPLVDGVPKWNPVYCFPWWVAEEIGGFDLRFAPAYYEDDDMIQRLHDQGIPIIAKREVEFSHPRPGNTIEALPGIEAIRQRSHDRFVEKWGHEPYTESILGAAWRAS